MSLRITNSIEKYNLDIVRSGWTSGADIANYLKSFQVDLFLSADAKDVTNAIKNGVAAAKILHSDVDFHNKHSDVATLIHTQNI